MAELEPHEVQSRRRDLIGELREVQGRGRNNYGYYEIYESTLADLLAVLEASKPTVVDREALVRIIRTEIAGYGITPSTAEPAAVTDILALLSPEETK